LINSRTWHRTVATIAPSTLNWLGPVVYDEISWGTLYVTLKFLHLLIGALVILNPSLPIVDIHSGTSPIDDPSVAQQLDMALQKHGFCYISGHNIATDTIKTAFEATHRFHALPESAKQDIKINPCHRGYIGFNTSTAHFFC